MKTTRFAREIVKGDDRLALKRHPDGRLWAANGEEVRTVRVRRCFPWTEPNRYISLRDGEENEFALVRDLSELGRESRQVLESALVDAGFVLEVMRLEAVEEEVEIRNWRVETRQGPRTFQTRLDDWPRELPGGGILIRDVAGDLYHVPDPSRLDKKSRDLLWVFVD